MDKQISCFVKLPLETMLLLTEYRRWYFELKLKNGADIVSVSKRLGHAKVSTTTDFYAQIIEEADADAADSLADVILRQKPTLRQKTG